MELKSLTIIPPGGWFYIQPQTKFKVEADDYETLVNRVIQHREYKGFTILRKEVEKDIQAQICDRVGHSSEYVKAA